MTVIDELKDLIARIEIESQHDEAVRILNTYLRTRLVQRLPEAEQAKKLYAAFQTGNIERVRAYQVSQHGRVREQCENFLRMLANESHPGQVRVLRSDEAHAS
jgi:hypothetical protein